MYIYPDNLKAKATMWLWSLKDLAIVGIIILFSVFAFAYAGVWFPLVIAGAYASYSKGKVVHRNLFDSDKQVLYGRPQ